jgi:hypothetical protein
MVPARAVAAGETAAAFFLLPILYPPLTSLTSARGERTV